MSEEKKKVEWNVTTKVRHCHVAFLPNNMRLVVEGWADVGETPPQWKWKVLWDFHTHLVNEDQRADTLSAAYAAAEKGAEQLAAYDRESPF